MKFKKHISIFFAFFLLLSNIGLAFNVHYCGKNIASISLKAAIPAQNFEKGCCEKITQKKHSCCSDKVFSFQQKSDNLIVKAFSFHSDFLFTIKEWTPIVFSSISNFKNSQITTYFCDANAPPLFKLYRQYIFYA